MRSGRARSTAPLAPPGPRGWRLGEGAGGGAEAPGGAYSYIINGKMVAGYAMVAAPARYGETGIKTFIVNHYGDVYETDLGPDTLKKLNAMTEYNPTSKWKLIE